MAHQPAYARITEARKQAYEAGQRHREREENFKAALKAWTGPGTIQEFLAGEAEKGLVQGRAEGRGRDAVRKAWCFSQLTAGIVGRGINSAAASVGAIRLPQMHSTLKLALSYLLATTTLAMGAVYVVPSPVETLVSMAFRVFPEPSQSREVARLADCALVDPVVDATSGRRHGVLVRNTADCADRNHLALIPSIEGARAQAVADEAVEGRYSGPGQTLTISWTGLARAVFYRATGQKSIGGTGPLLSAVEQVAGANSLTMGQKLNFLFRVGPSWAANHTNTADDRMLWATTHLQCARGVGGTGGGFTPIAGDLCAELFGKQSLEDLSPAEHCVVAALRKSTLAVPGPRASFDQLAEFGRSWESAKQRADEKCLSVLYDESELVEYQNELAALPLPDRARIVGLERQLNIELLGAVGYLRNRFSTGGLIPTAIIPSAQQSLVRLVDKTLEQRFLGKLEGSLCLPGSAGCEDQNLLDVGILVAEQMPDGSLVSRAVYQSRSGLLIQTTSLRGRASTVKALLVPLFAANGQTRLCREYVGNLKDADGFQGGDCADASSWMSLEEATARSSNLAFYWGLRQIRDADFKAWLELMGFDIKPDAQLSNLRRGVLIGDLASISPDKLVRAFAAVTGGGLASSPDEPDSGIDLTSAFDRTILQFSRYVLQAPVKNGTATALAKPLTDISCSDIEAKTGTADATTGRARDRLIIVGATCDGRRLIAFTLVGAPRPDMSLGQSIHGRDIVQLTGEALAAVAAEL